MKTLRMNDRHRLVEELSSMLSALSYQVVIDHYFDLATDHAVRDFQKCNSLAVTGEVNEKLWLLLKKAVLQREFLKDKLITDSQIYSFAKEFSLSEENVKNLLSIDDKPCGFLSDGRPIITYYNSEFWCELKKRGIEPTVFRSTSNSDILSELPSCMYRKSLEAEYVRMARASVLSNIPGVNESAYSATAWGRFQIMGYEYKTLGFSSVFHFVSELYHSEEKQLYLFGKLLDLQNLLEPLRTKSWRDFLKLYQRRSLLSSHQDLKYRYEIDQFVLE